MSGDFIRWKDEVPWHVRLLILVSFASGRSGWSPRPKGDYPSEFAAIESVARKLGIGSAETLRKWIRRAEIDAGQRPGVTTAESEQVKALKRENAELRRANEILKSASAFFAAEPGRPHRY
jgi:transposase